MKRYVRNKRTNIINVLLVIYDFVVFVFSYYFALLLRFDFKATEIPSIYLNSANSSLIIYSIICVLLYFAFGLYNSIWKFASTEELKNIVIANILCLLIQILLTKIFFIRMPISYYVIGIVIQGILTLFVRFSYRFVVLIHNSKIKKENNLLLIGAGEAGLMIIRDINRSSKGDEKIVAIIDDDSNKWGKTIEGIKIVGGRDSIVKIVKDYNIKKIVFAIPSIANDDRRSILNICNDSGCEVKTIPAMYKFVKNNLSIDSLKGIKIEDLLGREMVKINLEEVFSSISNKKILVTGGGGSIGSELCRQIANHNPKELIIFDIYENSTYEIELELKREHPELNLRILIGSVRDTKKIQEVFSEYKPEIVYHAAAHKHVPLMENSPCEAIKNNVLGTYNVAYAALINKARRFVLISTDKAVNPTNVMGASKRLCEMVIQSFNTLSPKQLSIFFKDNNLYSDLEKSETVYSAVRFGNVLGSNGSVIPIFKKQIENGGPITVTDPNIVRYFMTIPEAVSLVLQSSVYAKGGEIFVLDMGEQVKIDDLARKLIKLAGYVPDKDIKIEYTGLRPGEKMYEERLMDEEGLETTDNKLISIGKSLEIEKDFICKLSLLVEKANNNEEIHELIKELVPTYKMR